MINDIKKDAQERMSKSLESLGRNLASIRTGRAHPSILDSVKVPAWGSDMPLNQVATVTVPEPRLLSVQVWDTGLAGAVEKAVGSSGLGRNPAAGGQVIRVPLPELSDERRRELTKVAHNYAEQARVAVRHIRRDGMDLLKKLEKDGDLSQDDARRHGDEVQKATDEAIGDIDGVLAVKEQEIMQV